MSFLPLNGIRVLDLTRLLPGPYATHLLQGMGAQIIKVEDMGEGDWARTLRPLPKTKMGSAFTAANVGKRSLAINLKKEAGVKIVNQLVKNSDVLIESFRPGVMEKLGLGYQDVKELNPALVYCSLTGYGQKGNLAHLGGHDINFQGYAGILPRDGMAQACVPQTLTADLVGGSYTCVLAILSALLQKNRTGEGCYIDHSIMDSSLMLLPLEMAQFDQTGLLAEQATDRLNGGHPCYGIYLTADHRQITFAALEPKFWHTFCKKINREDLLVHTDLMEPGTRTTIRKNLEQIFSQKTQAEWVQLAEEWDVCLGPVLTAQEALEFAQQRKSEIFRAIHTDNGTSQVLSGLNLIGQDNGLASNSTLPQQGQHTRDILLENGWSADDIDVFFNQEVIA